MRMLWSISGWAKLVSVLVIGGTETYITCKPFPQGVGCDVSLSSIVLVTAILYMICCVTYGILEDVLDGSIDLVVC